MINYTWKIEALEYAPELDGLPKVITQIHWRYFAIEDEITVDTYGMNPAPAPDEEDFIPFKDLTEEIVIGWLEEQIDVPAMQLNLADQIENIKHPKTIVDNNPFNN